MSPLLDNPDSVMTTVVVTVIICGSVAIYFFIHKLRLNHHTGEIYVLWYTFSLALCIASAAIIYVDHFNSALEETMREALYSLTSPAEELTLVVAAIVIAIVPQIISFLISGAFGCASRPRYVAAISEWLVYSVMKFGSVVAEVVLAELLFLKNNISPLAGLVLMLSDYFWRFLRRISCLN